MPDSQQKLANKIIGILTVFFLVALLAVGMTLLISWKLEGGAAAINDAGSLRMRSYRIGNLLQHPEPVSGQQANLAGEIREFEHILADLRRGDPLRPLAPPRDNQISQQLERVEQDWRERIVPLLADFDRADDVELQTRAFQAYQASVRDFVAQIDSLVQAMERNYAFNTNLLRTLQVGLIILAVLGTLILIRFFFVQVIRPVDLLHGGIKRMLGDDFSVRLPLESRDEFGALASGFNQMVQHLQNLYATLEERVTSKTRTLAERNQELSVLYETTAFLNEPVGLQDICHGFRRRVRVAMGADACMIRLLGRDSEFMEPVSHEGLSAAFVAEESSLRCGECLCGAVLSSGQSQQIDTANPPPLMCRETCVREGFRTASAFSIVCQKQVVGVFNLYYRQERQFSPQEMALLDILGKHLGVAIENLRLRSREKEAAVYEERNLLAQELHDSIAQGLAYLNIQTQLLQDSLRHEETAEAQEVAERIRNGVQESYDDVRELLVHFRTRASHADLETALMTVLQRFEVQTGMAVNFKRQVGLLQVAEDEGIQIIHIVQEALSNIRKHAGAQHVAVRFEHEGARIRIVIEDDGVGFAPEASRSEDHVGLNIMRERAARIGGEVQIQSRVGEGTKIVLLLRHFSSPGA